MAAWLQLRASDLHEEEVAQRLSRGLAAHIAGHTALLGRSGLDAAAVKELFGMLMVVNPSVEVYLLGIDGTILAHLAPEGHLKRNRVDLQAVHRFLDGGALPIPGDDPRSEGRKKVFSAAPLLKDGRTAGYVYVVLLGEDHDAFASHVDVDTGPRLLLWITAMVGLVALGMGLLAFAWITRPLRALTKDVQGFQHEGFDAATMATEAGHDEIGQLRRAFVQMARRISDQWQALTAQDQQRRELVANISHDLRTPLTSLHGYLETLSVKSAELSESDRRRYLETALAHSRKVGRLAQELFELARLEYGGVKPDPERFSLAELTQDVLQKFELSAEARRLSLRADVAPGLPAVSADALNDTQTPPSIDR